MNSLELQLVTIFLADSVGLVFPVFGSDNSGIDGDYGSQPLLTGMLRDFRNFD